VIGDLSSFGRQARTGNQKRKRRHTVSEANRKLVRRAIEAVWNGGDFARLLEFVADDIVAHEADPANDLHGPEELTQYYSALRGAFPDIHFTVEDQIAEGDRVVTRWTASATHRGTFQGLPPTGKTIRISGIDVNRFAGGRVVECWSIVGELSVLRQLGVLPSPDSGARREAA
jgi:steroid delta-isomerase-like uncharacterized protein